jgi:hypothetical protein
MSIKFALFLLIILVIIYYNINSNKEHMTHLNKQADAKRCGGLKYVKLENNTYVCKYSEQDCKNRGYETVKKGPKGFDDRCINISKQRLL